MGGDEAPFPSRPWKRRSSSRAAPGVSMTRCHVGSFGEGGAAAPPHAHGCLSPRRFCSPQAGSSEVRAGRGRAPRAEKSFRRSLSGWASFRGPARPSESLLGSPPAQRGCSPSFRHAKARIMREWPSDRAYRPELFVERPGNLHKARCTRQGPSFRHHAGRVVIPFQLYTHTRPADGHVVIMRSANLEMHGAGLWGGFFSFW